MVGEDRLLAELGEEEVNISGLVGRMVSVVIGTMLLPTLLNILHPSLIRERNLWVTSPTGKTTLEMPFYTALRIVRKQGWNLAEVVPVEIVRNISRWEHLKMAIKGGNARWT